MAGCGQERSRAGQAEVPEGMGCVWELGLSSIPSFPNPVALRQSLILSGPRFPLHNTETPWVSGRDMECGMNRGMWGRGSGGRSMGSATWRVLRLPRLLPPLVRGLSMLLRRVPIAVNSTGAWRGYGAS